MKVNHQAVVDAINVGIVVVDKEQTVVTWNRWMTKYSGVTSEKALGQKLENVFSEPVAPACLRAVSNTLAYRSSVVLSAALHLNPLPLFNPYESVEKPGRIYQNITTTGLFEKGKDPQCLIQIFDASVSIKREKVLRSYSETLRKEAVTDGLTGIYNRRFFDESYSRALASARRSKSSLSVFMIDIDCFKLYNDFYGHQLGDQAIKSVAQALKSVVVRGEDIVARYGGEEFVLVLPNTKKADAEVIGQRLNDAVNALAIAHEKSTATHHVSISIGICSGIPDGRNMIKKADDALYQSKRNGRNRYTCFALDEIS